jgi:hypothetical protein
MKVRYLNQNVNDDWMVGCTNTETLQATQGVCAEEMPFPHLMLEEQESSVHSTEFGSENAVKTRQMI